VTSSGPSLGSLELKVAMSGDRQSVVKAINVCAGENGIATSTSKSETLAIRASLL
jgi:hypothetical protein